jgi:hypothetical protein
MSASATELEGQALQAMDEERWEDALRAWERCFAEAELPLSWVLLYALCLAQLDRLVEANGIYDDADEAISQLPAGARRAQLQQLLEKVGEYIAPLEEDG